ncbi:hypothetical protein ACERII_20055 [Evansella sp. AB-rgal1]|uniref:hypothetical protein n=1 Tax=Evansella sp. AB-rgal1 TaxID=3242696 RepID=UPI00359D2D2D
MIKRLLTTSLFTLLLLFVPLATAFAAAAGDGENGAASGSSLMEGPFIILAFGTLVIMIYYCFRD